MSEEDKVKDKFYKVYEVTGDNGHVYDVLYNPEEQDSERAYKKVRHEVKKGDRQE